MTGKRSSYSHALVSLGVIDHADSFVEATNSSVHYSQFMEVFNCDRICLLEPLHMNPKDWAIVTNGVTKQVGKKYDNLFDIQDDTRVTCTEMIMMGLRDLPDYKKQFPHLEYMIQESGNLTPQMFRDCTDFRVALETRR